MGEQRLDKLLAATGRWSRREAKALIKEGRVLVGGMAAVDGADKVDAEKTPICIDGEALTYRAYTYVMLNKPVGVLTATEDRRQPTVLDFLPVELRRRGIAPVGRLDKDTEGLLLLTNDGALAHRLLSPKNHVDKTYCARLSSPLGEEDRAAFAQGVTLGDGTQCQAAELELLEDGRTAVITLREGKYHQIKRMVASRGSSVCCLKRLSMGSLKLDPSLKSGEYRFLTAEEIIKLGGKV